MSKIIYWLFSQTQLGKLVDGNKRIIGFTFWLLGFLVQGLSAAALYFPDTPIIGQVKDQLASISVQLGDWLKNLGISVMVVGVASDAAYQKHAPE